MQHSVWVKLGDIRSLAKAIKTNRQQALAIWETENETLQEMRMKPEDPMTASAGWSLTVDRVAKRPEGLELTVLQESIETEMANAAPETQWTMNMALAQIGTCFPPCVKRPSQSEINWLSIAIIPFPKDVPPHLLLSGLTNW